MNKDFLIKKIYYIEELVFKCNFHEVIKETVEIVENIEENFKFSKEENQRIWKEIIYYLTLSLENKDYLLASDILKYELKTVLQNENLF
ncbi:hypothetical protein [Clostridium sp. KNHs214]|uniref:hypothetical protein n=1 Tax=Clostridium sp. KNHs214 TaxID=1540257 RepID=UPI0005554866|nr:hypothetical protein [Clostridium sp. KNHs214]